MIERLICISLNWGAVDPKVCADLYVVLCVYIRFLCFYELGVASKRAAGAFFLEKRALPDLLTMSILGIVRIVRISVSMELGTCLKSRTPKNHEFWRYSDLQISHGEPFREQNDELNFGRQTRIRL